MHNFTTLLADNKPLKKLQSLEYRYSQPLPETVHDLLLAKSDGSFWLVVWGEMVADSAKVDVLLPQSVKSIEIYDPTVGVTPERKLRNKALQPVSLDINDHPVLLKIK